MKCTILHESRGRLRVHVCNVRMTLHRADVLEAYLNHHDAVSKAKVYGADGRCGGVLHRCPQGTPSPP